jgi:two-component system cell cycle response regulator DivK
MSEPAPSSETVRRGPTVLIVDDFADGLELYSRYLAFKGFQVLAASSGSEGLELARRHHPDLILLDIRMARMSGIDVVRMLRTDPAFTTTPVVALTSQALETEHRAARAAGFDEVISKPCLPDDLVVAVERLIATRRSPTLARNSPAVTTLPDDWPNGNINRSRPDRAGS